MESGNLDRSSVIRASSNPGRWGARAERWVGTRDFDTIVTSACGGSWTPSRNLTGSGLDMSSPMSNRERFRYDIAGSKADWLEYVPSGCRLSGRSIDFAFGDFSEQLDIVADRPRSQSMIDGMAAELAVAVDLVNAHQGYAAWVAAVTRAIIPTWDERSTASSGSSSLLSGLYYCEVAIGPMLLAESMIHESAHQWYFVAECIGPLVNFDDKNEYYSPFKKKPRELRTILQTYHAFANVVIFYNWIEKNYNYQNSLFEMSGLEKMRGNVQQIETYLDKTNGLTSAGQDFFIILKENLKKSSID